MRYAVLSDVHANWQAWTAVRDEILAEGVDDIVCLGDVVGYGPSPGRVLEDVDQHCDNIVIGNHDAAACGRFDLSHFADIPRIAAEWTMKQLREDHLAILHALPAMIKDERIVFTHAATHAPEEYGYVWDNDDAAACFQSTQKQIIFMGHTHLPEFFIMLPDGTIHMLDQAMVKIEEGCRYLVNVGSVGDPRDGGKEASHCICDLDEGYIQLKKTPFDIEEHYAEIRQYPDLALPHFLADRAETEQATVRSQQAIRVKKASGMALRVARSRALKRRTRHITSKASIHQTNPEMATLPAREKSKNPLALILIASAVMAVLFLAFALGVAFYVRGKDKRTAQVPPAPVIARPTAAQPAPPPSRSAATPDKPEEPDVPAQPDDTFAADNDSVFRLNVDDAQRTGGTLKSAGGVRCIGMWQRLSIKASWPLWVEKPGTYKVRIRYSLEDANGHAIRFGSGNESSACPIEQTGTWNDFVGKDLGQITLRKGRADFFITGEQKTKNSLMLLAGVRLTPVETNGKMIPRTGTPADDQGVFRLSAAGAKRHGPKLKTHGGVSCLGYWHRPIMRASWKLWVEKTGVYTVRIRYALEDAEGHELRVGCDTETFASPIEKTGAWENFAGRDLGRVTLAQGENEFYIMGEKQVEQSLMLLAAVRLTPAGPDAKSTAEEQRQLPKNKTQKAKGLTIEDAKGYKPLYVIDLAGLGRNIHYDVDNSDRITGRPTRVAYCLQLKKKNGELRYVYVSMDAFSTDLKKLGIPASNTGAVFQQSVNNMTILSNVPEIETGTGITGNIEFWPNSYTQHNSTGVKGASDQLFDFGDRIGKPNGYGSMQVHNTAAKQTLFAINHWNQGGDGADIGIGNGKGKNPDWTFAQNGRYYSVKRLHVLVKLEEPVP